MWSLVARRKRRLNFGTRSRNNGATSFEKLEPRQLLCIALSGSISVDTTLSDTTSEYCLVDDLTVDSGATLTVDPGVTIEFRNDAVDLIVNEGSVDAVGAVFSRGGFGDGLISITVNSGGTFGATNSQILGASNITVNDGGLFGVQGGEFNFDFTSPLHLVTLNSGAAFFARDVFFRSDLSASFNNFNVAEGARLNFVDSNVQANLGYAEGAQGSILGTQFLGRLRFSSPLEIANTIFNNPRPADTTVSGLASLRSGSNSFVTPGQTILLDGQGAYSGQITPLGEVETYIIQDVTLDKTNVISDVRLRRFLNEGATVTETGAVYMTNVTMENFLSFNVLSGGLMNITSSEVSSVQYQENANGYIIGSKVTNFVSANEQFIQGNTFEGISIDDATIVVSVPVYSAFERLGNDVLGPSTIQVRGGAFESGESVVIEPIAGATNTVVSGVFDIEDGATVSIQPGVIAEEFNATVSSGAELFIDGVVLDSSDILVKSGGRAGLVNVLDAGDGSIEFESGSFGNVIGYNGNAFSRLSIQSDDVWVSDSELSDLEIIADRIPMLSNENLNVTFLPNSIIDLGNSNFTRNTVVKAIPETVYRIHNGGVDAGVTVVAEAGVEFQGTLVGEEFEGVFNVQGRAFMNNVVFSNLTLNVTGFLRATETAVSNVGVFVRGQGRFAAVDSTFASVDTRSGTFNAIGSTFGRIDLDFASSGFLFQNTFNPGRNFEIASTNYAIRQNRIFSSNIITNGNTGDVIDMRHNRWGTLDENVIRDRIFDRLDDASLPLIEFDPIAT